MEHRSSNQLTTFALFFLCACASLQLIVLMNENLGFAGYDYFYFIPRLFAGTISFRAEGLSIPQYYIYFCGALPFFGNPVSMFYSLPQFLSFVVDPWTACQLSAALILTLGTLATHALLKELGYSSPATLSAATLIATSGFFRARMLLGHLNFQSYLIIPLLLFFLFTRTLHTWSASLLLGLFSAYVVHSGGHFVAVISIPALLMAASLLLCFRDSLSPKQILVRATVGSLIALLLSAGKLTAIFHYMLQFPRVQSFDEVANHTEGLSFFFSHFFNPGGAKPFLWGWWEYYNELPVVVLLPVILALLLLILGLRKKQNLIPISIFTLTAIGGYQFSVGHGAVYELLKDFPGISSFRVNGRISGAFLLPLVILSVTGIELLRRISLSHLVAALLMVTAFVTPYPVEKTEMQLLKPFDIQPVPSFFQTIKESSLEQLAPDRFLEFKDDDLSAMRMGASNRTCFTTNLAPEFYLSRLEPGPFDKGDGEHYNLLNPACLMYPKENQCDPGAYIQRSDGKNYQALLASKNPAWPVPRSQQVANMLSVAALIGCMLYLLIVAVRRCLYRSKSKKLSENV